MVEVVGAFRTQDMALATVLVSEGYTYNLERLNTQRVCWVFDEPPTPDKALAFKNLVAAYQGHGCRVEPQSFLIEVGRVREGMLIFLGVPNRRRRPGAPAPQTT